VVAFVVRYGGDGGNSWGHQLPRHPRILKQSGHCKHLGRFTTMHNTFIRQQRKGTIRLYMASKKGPKLNSFQ
jgi:hypothetical protein